MATFRSWKGLEVSEDNFFRGWASLIPHNQRYALSQRAPTRSQPRSVQGMLIRRSHIVAVEHSAQVTPRTNLVGYVHCTNGHTGLSISQAISDPDCIEDPGTKNSSKPRSPISNHDSQKNETNARQEKTNYSYCDYRAFKTEVGVYE
jgi:hypothetical protein